jgi:magnesium-transporting ATPase (P-type)
MHDLEYSSAVQTTDTLLDSSELTFEAENKKTHMTLLFNTFIFLQIFNMINCRVVGARDLNPFQHFFDNYTFATVFTVVCVVQLSTTVWLNFMFDTVMLSPLMYGESFLWGASSLLISLLVKLTPEAWVENLPVKIDEG